jgi:RNA polymerase sigma-70 factor, ECF subfamily
MSPELDKGVLKQIEGKARRLSERPGFTPQDYEDLHQDLALKVMESLRFYDPAKGRLHAFVAKVLRRKAHELLETRYGQKAAFHDKMLSLDAPAPGSPSDRPMIECLAQSRVCNENANEADQVLLACDLEEAIKALPPEQAVVCRKLMEGLDQEQTAAALGISISILRTRILHIRQVFEARGLETYLIDDA